MKAVYGLGGAFVDTHIPFDRAKLPEWGLGKITAIVDPSLHQRFLDRLDPSVSYQKSPGGCIANSIHAIAQLGGTAWFSGRVGLDESGQIFRDAFKGVGAELLSSLDPTRFTGSVLVLAMPDGSQYYLINPGSNIKFDHTDIDRERLPKAAWVFFQGHLFESATGAREAFEETVQIARCNGVRIALSMGHESALCLTRPVFKELIPLVDLVFCNRAEACGLMETNNVHDAFARMERLVSRAVVTLGAEGALVREQSRSVHIPAVPCEVIDTTGAGDMFAGAYLHAQISGLNFERSGRFASQMAARKISQRGARLQSDKAVIAAEARSFMAAL